MREAFDTISTNSLNTVLMPAFGAVYTGLLSHHQRSMSHKVQQSLLGMNFKVCKFINKSNGDCCTNLPVRDRRTGEMSLYCRTHKYACEKNDRLKSLEEQLSGIRKPNRRRSPSVEPRRNGGGSRSPRTTPSVESPTSNSPNTTTRSGRRIPGAAEYASRGDSRPFIDEDSLARAQMMEDSEPSPPSPSSEVASLLLDLNLTNPNPNPNTKPDPKPDPNPKNSAS